MNKPLPYSKINTILLILLLGLSLGVLYVTVKNNRNASIYTLRYNPESGQIDEDFGIDTIPMGHIPTGDTATGPQYQSTNASTAIQR